MESGGPSTDIILDETLAGQAGSNLASGIMVLASGIMVEVGS